MADAAGGVQGAVDEHKKELEFEQEAVRELEYREKQANTRRAQLEREVASLRDKATQDQSGRGEIWNKLLKQQDEHKAALGEKEVRGLGQRPGCAWASCQCGCLYEAWLGDCRDSNCTQTKFSHFYLWYLEPTDDNLMALCLDATSAA